MATVVTAKRETDCAEGLTSRRDPLREAEPRGEPMKEEVNRAVCMMAIKTQMALV